MTEHNPYQPPQSNVVATPTEVGKKLTIDEALAAGYDFDIQEVIKDAWAKVEGVKLPFFLGFLTLFVIGFIAGIILAFFPEGVQRGVNIVLNIFFNALGAGFIVLALKRLNGQAISFKDDFFSIFAIFNVVLLACFLTYLLTLIGLILLIIPGLYLAVAYSITNWIIVDNPEVSAWQAMEASRKLVTQHWFKFFILILILAVICIISAIPLGIGLIWTLPLAVLTMGTVYKKIFYVQ